jgi:hypothetical protein
VTGKSHVEIGNLNPTSKTFNKTEIDNGVVKTVSTRDITQSLAASLFGELSLGVEVKALGLLPLASSCRPTSPSSVRSAASCRRDRTGRHTALQRARRSACVLAKPISA